jgi:hypothetical protein
MSLKEYTALIAERMAEALKRKTQIKKRKDDRSDDD